MNRAVISYKERVASADRGIGQNFRMLFFGQTLLMNIGNLSG